MNGQSFLNQSFLKSFVPLMGLVLILGNQVVFAQTAAPPPRTEESDRILQACSQNQAETLPIPFQDLSPNHWAFKAVMSLHYCGAYRGSIPQETTRSVLKTSVQNPPVSPGSSAHPSLLYPMPMLP